MSIFCIVLCTHLWLLYYIYVNNVTTPVTNFQDIKVKKTPPTLEFTGIMLFGIVIIWFYIVNYIYIQMPSTQQAFWQVVHISNNGYFYFYLIAFIFGSFLVLSFQLLKQNLTISVEYFLLICLVALSSFFLINSTNLFFTIFVLELVALLIFGKFTVTKLYYPLNLIGQAGSTSPFLNQFSYGLFNSLFFQFWANFVSSVCLFFTLINLHYFYGTSNLFMINFFLHVLDMNSYIPVHINSITLFVFVTGLFIKLGLSPYQFFKIETYKGIPLFSVINYTTLYLCIYIYFFLYLILFQIPTIKTILSVYFFIFFGVSTLYLVSLLFDTKNFKAFLSYSTLITVTNLFLVVLLI